MKTSVVVDIAYKSVEENSICSGFSCASRCTRYFTELETSSSTLGT